VALRVEGRKPEITTEYTEIIDCYVFVPDHAYRD
jgi:hypothetical protein